MLILKEEKHLVCFDKESNLYSSYAFVLEKSGEGDENEKKNETTIEI